MTEQQPIHAPVILADSPEAATLTTVVGWVSRDGFFFGENEWAARHAGSTHRPCAVCAVPIAKSFHILCPDCRLQQAMSTYLALPEVEWDGVNPVYSETLERYYTHPDDAYGDIWPDQGVDSLCLFLTEPNYAHELDADDLWWDELAEDERMPAALEAAINAVNTVISGGTRAGRPGESARVIPRLPPLSWSPTRKRLKTSLP